MSLVLLVLLATSLSFSALANVNVSLSWNASSDTNVTGYNFYCSTNNINYTNSVSVGRVTTAIISNMPCNTPYFIAAKAHNGAGQQGPFSVPVAFMGVATTPDNAISIKPLPKNYSSDPLRFSLDATAPPGATINPTNGVVSWIPGRGFASTTNSFNVLVTDANNPAMNIAETVIVNVSDYLEFKMGHMAVSAGGMTKIPLTVAASSSLTNVQITLDWPSAALLNPTLTFFSPIVSGSLQKLNGQLVVQLQTSATHPLIGTNLVGEINFQAASSSASKIFDIPAATATGTTSSGASYANVLMPAGEVVVVGSTPMLRTHGGHTGRSLDLYATPGTYTLQYATSLAKPITWNTLSTYAQTNVAQSIALTATNPVIYYRLHQL